MIDMVVHRFELRAMVARIMRLLLRPNLDPDAEQPVERQRRAAAPALPAPALAEGGKEPEEPLPAGAPDGGSEGGDELRQ